MLDESAYVELSVGRNTAVLRPAKFGWFIVFWGNRKLFRRTAKYLSKFEAAPQKMAKMGRALFMRKELKIPE